MKSENVNSKVYNFNKIVKAAIQAQKMQGHDLIYCSATLYQKGKKLNSIEKADSTSFSKLVLNYVHHEAPDKLKVELKGADDELLWSKTFFIEAETEPTNQSRSDFRGFGEAEISDLVSQKISEIRRNEELETLRSYKEQLESENENLQNQLGELEQSLSAKQNIEYYSNIIGLALPGLAKMLSKTSLGSSLGMLAGINDSSEPNAPTGEKDQRQTIIELVSEFMNGLDMTNLGHLYLIFIELSNNPALIPILLSNLTQKNHSHDSQHTS